MYFNKICREMAETETKVSFKKINKRSVRVRKDSDEDNDDTEEMNKEEFEKTRELQKLRKRAAGTNIETLASVKKQNVDDDDPLGADFHLKPSRKRGNELLQKARAYHDEEELFHLHHHLATLALQLFLLLPTRKA